MDSDNSKEIELAKHIAEIEVHGLKVILVVGDLQQINEMVEKLGKKIEIVTPVELANKVFEIKPVLAPTEILPPLKNQSLPKKDKEYWKPTLPKSYRRK